MKLLYTTQINAPPYFWRAPSPPSMGTHNKFGYGDHRQVLYLGGGGGGGYYNVD